METLGWKHGGPPLSLFEEAQAAAEKVGRESASSHRDPGEAGKEGSASKPFPWLCTA